MLQTQRAAPGRSALGDRLFKARRRSVALAAPLSPEDQVVQAHDDASPTKWHLAHVTWFFETFVLRPHWPAYRMFDERFGYCFNSYYESEGARHPRPQRGLLTRPTHDEVLGYRAHVDDALGRMFDAGVGDEPAVAQLIETGINHEEQHQELMMTDILALFAKSPIRPSYRERSGMLSAAEAPALTYSTNEGGIRQIGNRGGFGWDNEYPRHDALLHPFALADRLVTNGEWLAFMRDGGYRQPLLWLADGWARVQDEDWTSPLYWEAHDDQWRSMTLEGFLPVDPAAPVCHVSFYEADAFARWAGARLPTEFEWEHAAEQIGARDEGSSAVRPPPAQNAARGPQQMFGAVWQWTQSAYLPYPRYRSPAGALGEYNGKFMCSQQVLRGSSCVTPPGHSRTSYRNFFYPWQRWQFMGLRLAQDVA